MDGARERRVGVMYDREQLPENLVAFAQVVEENGADDLWLVEDLGCAGSMSSAAMVLPATRNLRIGIGITPAPLRNPALLAMELAVLARLHPGRLAAGIGHGVCEWMEQVGARPSAPLALLEETLLAVRRLLDGETVTIHGRCVHLDSVRLMHPPTTPPPLLAGVVRPRSLELSGRSADGTILIEGRGPDEVADAQSYISAGRASAGLDAPHEVVSLLHAYVTDDKAEAAQMAVPVRAEFQEFLGVPEEDVYLAIGPDALVAERIDALWQAGATTVVLHLLGEDQLSQVRRVLSVCGRG